MVLVCVGLKIILKRGQCGGNLCNDPCGDVYKGVYLLKRFSFVFESCFESVVKCGFENRQVFCFASLIQVTKSFVYPIVLKRLLLCFNLFNKFVPPLPHLSLNMDGIVASASAS